MITRRGFLGSTAPAFLYLASTKPKVFGVAAGDPLPGRTLIWARADRAARMIVDWRTPGTKDSAPRRVVGPHCLDTSDYTGRIEIAGLPPGAEVEYEVRFQDLSNERVLGDPVAGAFRAAGGRRDVRFLFSGDTVGQGWGINPEWGGLKIYETMRLRKPDFFIHSGDTIYADNPVPAEVKLRDGRIWRNVVTEEKSKVAETLDEFRGNYRYNLLDKNLQAFQREVPQIWQWDDHEVANNWSPGRDFDADPRYQEKNLPLLVARATRAFLDYAPMRLSDAEPERIYRYLPHSALLDTFVLDMRSYRAANTHNRQPAEGEATRFLGHDQIGWFLASLKASRATWKIIASDMPIGLIVGDGKDAEGRNRYEAVANGDGPPLGREFEIARILRFVKANRIRNVVWVTADVHYCAAHYYDPAKAQFTDFHPFWEFVAGPLNAGTFGPGVLDPTFGPKVIFEKAPAKGLSNLPPWDGYQFFGEGEVDAKTQSLRMTLRDVEGNALFTKTLTPDA